MISRFFIDRPIFASVVSAFIVIAGLAAIRALPVTAYPDILPPEVEVTAFYPGANSATVAETVAAPLEQQINGVEGMLYLRSASAGNGSLSITVTFAIGTDPDLATINVDNRVQAAVPTLPEEVRRQGVAVRKRSSTILQIATIDSTDPRHDQIFVSNYASLNVIDELRRIPGVGDAQNFGAKDYSIRVWMRPDRMAQLGLTPADVAAAIREQNSQFAAGRVGQAPTDDPVDFTFSVTTMGRLQDPEQFGEIILRTTEDGAFVRLKDVARVELGSRDYDFVGKRSGKPTVPIGIFLQPGANALEVGDAVKARLAELIKSAPPGFDFSVPYDTTKFVRVSIVEVLKTLGESSLSLSRSDARRHSFRNESQGALRPVPGRALEGVGQLQHAPVAAVAPHDLHANREAAGREPPRHRDRGVRHERHVPARAHPVDVVGHGLARDLGGIRCRHVEGRHLGDGQHEVVVAREELATLRVHPRLAGQRAAHVGTGAPLGLGDFPPDRVLHPLRALRRELARSARDTTGGGGSGMPDRRLRNRVRRLPRCSPAPRTRAGWR